MNISRYIFVFVVAIGLFSGAYADENDHRFKVKSVKIAGNHAYTDRRLHRVMITRPSVLFNPVYYYSEVLTDDIAGIEQFYHQNGYLGAQVEGFSVDLDSLKKRADIRIRLIEGELTRIDGVTVFDNTVFSDSVILRLLPLKPGDPLRHNDIETGTRSILTLYADRGYLEASAVPEIRLDTLAHLAQIDYFIKELTQYRIDSTIIKGLTKTRLKLVKRELEFKDGDIVDYSRLLKTQRNLYLTGLFQSAFVRPVSPGSGEAGKKDVLIEIKENKSREYNFSLGYGTVEKGRTGIGLFNTNWRGSGQKLGLTVKLSFVQAGVEASVTEPWTFGTRWSTDMALSMEYLIDPSYDQKTIGGRLSIARTLHNKVLTNLTYRHQNVELSRIKIETLPEEIRTQIRSLKLTISRDTRDNLFNPTKGFYLEHSIETAGLFRSASESFTRIRFIGRYLRPVTIGTGIASGLEIGWMGSPRGFNSIVFSERLYAGGPSSIRGIKYKHAGPLDENGYPIGGGFLIVWNAVEVRQSIYKMLGGVVFLDVGTVWNNIDEATIEGLRTTPGVGLRLDTALGLFRIDYGFNIRPRGSESSGMIYFSVGQAF